MSSRGSLRVFLLASLFTLTACSYHQESAEPQTASTAAARPAIVFMTDFGTANDAVAICRAVIFGIAPPDSRHRHHSPGHVIFH